MQEEKNSKLQYGIVNFERRRSPRFSVDLPIEKTVRFFRVVEAD